MVTFELSGKNVPIVVRSTSCRVIFSYASLFDTREERAQSRPAEERRGVREVRQEILLPFLHGLAAEGS